MKKSLIALAVLAAAGAASAQSSVTLYGIVDAYVGNVKDTIAKPGTSSQNVVNSAGLSNNRWGLKGSEDLGGGLKANFVLESGFTSDNGAAAGDLFGRQSTVGLSGNFGSVNLGRNYTPYQSLRGLTNNTVDSNMAVTDGVWSAGSTYKADGTVDKSTDYVVRASNSIRFDSNVYSGFSGSVAYGFGENKNASDNLNNSSTDIVSLNVQYANGPLLVGYAHEQVQQKRNVTVPSTTKFNLIAGSYDFGVAKLVGGYNNVKRDAVLGLGAEDKEYQFGVSAPFGATTVYFGYAQSKNENANGSTFEKRAGFDLAATYALSKRTTAYAGYKTYEIKDVADREVKAFGVGVKHTF